MNNKQVYLAFTVFTLLVCSCLVPIVTSEESPTPTPTETPEPTPTPIVYENISVTLKKPIHNETITDNQNVSFVFEPCINGTDKFYRADLIVNGSIVASNETTLTAFTDNTINYKLPVNGTYNWNIRLENSSKIVMAETDFNLTVAIYEPDPTPTPTPTPSPTLTPTPTPYTPTVTPTKLPTPTPTPEPPVEIDAWTIVIIAIFVFSGVLIGTVLLLRRRVK
ncbi:MAG: hypothetical protein WDA42_03710 [Candidatus Bathyarchaeia archaeon]